MLSDGSVSNGPFVSGPHHDCRTNIPYDNSVSNGPCDRGQNVITTNRRTTCARSRVVPFLTTRLYREPPTEAKRLLNAMIAFITVCAIGTITANRLLHICLCSRMAPFLTSFVSGTHHGCQTKIPYSDSVSNGPCDRRQKVITTNRPTTCACCRVVPFLTARSY